MVVLKFILDIMHKPNGGAQFKTYIRYSGVDDEE